MCLCEKERERERKTEKQREGGLISSVCGGFPFITTFFVHPKFYFQKHNVPFSLYSCVSLCMCLCIKIQIARFFPLLELVSC